MSKSTQLFGALALIVLLSVSIIPSQAKDSYELDKEANKLESHAMKKEAAADAEQKETSLAVDEGKKGTAALHAKRAAQEQKVANDLKEKADKVQGRAAKKAVKEAY